MNFKSFSFDPQIQAGIAAADYSVPTPIQSQAIPKIMQGCDLMGLAQTGTGKTAAFVLPILQRLLNGKRGGVRALILAPTRELAEQIHQEIVCLGAQTGLRSVSIYGGVGIQPQIRALKSADIAVACPGRLLDHMGRKTVNLSRVEVLVLDEADQMFDMGFLPDIRRIISQLPTAGRQNLLFSATMPDQIRRLADDMLCKPVKVQVTAHQPAETVSHAFYPVAQHLKAAFLFKLLAATDFQSVLVFTRTKHRARQLAAKLDKAGFQTTSLQGNLSQGRRREAMDGFKSGKYKILVATDIAARGIDVSRVSHVINFDMPTTSEIYIHRIGRTGRAERRGTAFTLITDDDRQMATAICNAAGSEIERRTLPGFDYGTPSASRPKRGRRRSPASKSKGKSGPGRQQRAAQGVFAWLSPRNTQPA